MSMKVNDFLAMVKKACEVKTLYVMGGFGAPAGYGNNRTRYSSNNAYNERPERTKLIKAASDDTFFFDCVGLCKGILWGWRGDACRVYGGADYANSKVIPDYDAKQMMFSGCTGQSKDFSSIVPGEFLWFDGHCGIYLGNGLAAESSPKWKDGVQITAVLNIGKKSGYNGRTWTYHGKLKYVDYSGAKPVPTPTPTTDDYKTGNIYNVTCKGPLRIRKDAGTNNDIIGDLYKGDKVLCEGTKKDSAGNTWMKITGWIAAKYDGDKYVG